MGGRRRARTFGRPHACTRLENVAWRSLPPIAARVRRPDAADAAAREAPRRAPNAMLTHSFRPRRARRARRARRTATPRAARLESATSIRLTLQQSETAARIASRAALRLAFIPPTQRSKEVPDVANACCLLDGSSTTRVLSRRLRGPRSGSHSFRTVFRLRSAR
ncbi:hypothetical protein [Burkholderia pseudomallei]|uniref:hypothetical protein n=2 Tax=Burkholderia pseudomallei TaxID=28450 RepID=UPI000ACD8B1E|nr:hypothetical protein [Burkholderia pseudomallei]AYX03432.1 hypothetical protein EGY14_05800 [Burkholderia pseudomallei]RXS82105.1 hypothetical protein C2U63_07155 [Burkholderia pseudomallei]